MREKFLVECSLYLDSSIISLSLLTFSNYVTFHADEKKLFLKRYLNGIPIIE